MVSIRGKPSPTPSLQARPLTCRQTRHLVCHAIAGEAARIVLAGHPASTCRTLAAMASCCTWGTIST